MLRLTGIRSAIRFEYRCNRSSRHPRLDRSSASTREPLAKGNKPRLTCSDAGWGRKGLFDRDKNRVPDLVLDVIGEVALAGCVLDKDDVAGRDEPAFAIARGNFHRGVEVHDVLPPRGRMPIDIVLGLGLAKDDAGRWQLSRQFAAPPFLDPFDLDIAEMRLAFGVGVEIV